MDNDNDNDNDNDTYSYRTENPKKSITISTTRMEAKTGAKSPRSHFGGVVSTRETVKYKCVKHQQKVPRMNVFQVPGIGYRYIVYCVHQREKIQYYTAVVLEDM